MSKKLGAVVDIKNHTMSKDQFPQEVREFFRLAGQLVGSQVGGIGVQLRD